MSQITRLHLIVPNCFVMLDKFVLHFRASVSLFIDWELIVAISEGGYIFH